MTTPPSKQLDQFVVRLPPGLRDRIKASAERRGHSMNAVIVNILENRFPVFDPWMTILDAVTDIHALVAHGPDETANFTKENHAALVRMKAELMEMLKTVKVSENLDAIDRQIVQRLADDD